MPFFLAVDGVRDVEVSLYFPDNTLAKQSLVDRAWELAPRKFRTFVILGSRSTAYAQNFTMYSKSLFWCRAKQIRRGEMRWESSVNEME